jgi:biopolymer transport protein TolR
MAMSGGEAKGGVAEINVTPLIDVLLVLLIIFMVIVPALPRGLESAVPQPSKSAAEPSIGPVMLEVRAGLPDSRGAAAASYRVDGKDVAPRALGGVLLGTLAMRQQRSLMISADRSLNYDAVVHAIAVAKEAGAWPIGIAGPKNLGGVR